MGGWYGGIRVSVKVLTWDRDPTPMYNPQTPNLSAVLIELQFLCIVPQLHRHVLQ